LAVGANNPGLFVIDRWIRPWLSIINRSFLEFWSFCIKKSETPNTQKAQNWKLWAAATRRQDFFQDFEYATFFRTLRSTSGVKMKEIEDVYFFALHGSVLLSRDMCFKRKHHVNFKLWQEKYPIELEYIQPKRPRFDFNTNTALHEQKVFEGYSITDPTYFSERYAEVLF
jgi:hypothetical protein